jgi:excisionase family DNA binding protein
MGMTQIVAAGQRRLLTVSEVCDLLNLPKWKVMELLRNRVLGSVVHGRTIRIKPEDVDQFLEGWHRPAKPAGEKP